ncbi:protein FMP52, mitochondrial [Podospora aff. communis PSN243]|uniref:Protein FMP52, mitochondrial n=1 Tax=Podospora aff. communis PSN243 TaxID=3040156 RepID=A0AAV9H135_9PEZI|nr:protein FMP52, mitochondrial [Podospora aff. communis PSN243]
MSTTALIGSTGLVGSNILTTLLSSPNVSTVQTISRRAPKATPPKLNAILEPDTSIWKSRLASLSPKPTTVFSALGTTRAAAGGIANQWKIDHDLNVELAREDTVKELGFDNAVILRPGLILGEREEKKPLGGILNPAVHGIGKVLGLWAQDMLGQDALVIARAAVHAARLVEEGKAPEKYWVLEGGDIVRLGRTEWKE